jgi:ribosomal protein S18 acetylase RimI-like enzyme
LREKKELVGRGRSHGILVYTVGKPVGWCQYGRQEELPRIDNGRYYQPVENRGVEYRMGSKGEGKKLWRITCFVVDKRYRQRGIASAALTAALEAIQRKGGGIVEAFPIIRWEDLCRARIRRCGHAPSFGNTSTHGTQSMFEKQGFKTVAPYGLSNVLMRRIV